MSQNKEKIGETIRFSIRLPKRQHMWLKEQSIKTKNSYYFESMNSIIEKAIDYYMELINNDD